MGLAVGGCYSGTDGTLGGAGHDDGAMGTDPGAADSSDDEGGSSGDGGNDADDGDTDDEPVAGCEERTLGQSPMRRLTGLEYDNTVRDLLGDTSAPSHAFVADESVAGFAANAVAPLSATQLDQYFSAAEDVAATAVAERWDDVVGCGPEDDACLDGFIDRFGMKAFRRPLRADEQSGYLELLHDTQAESDGTAAVEVVIQAMLMSPSFLYHAETHSGDEALAALDGYAVASRMSYFLWASMPDEELFELAGAGMLTDPEVLEVQARRMLDDDKAADALASFHRQWLAIDNLTDSVKDAEMFPEWDEDLALSMQAETIAFADEVIRRGDANLRTLLTAPWSVVDGDLADLYGVDAPATGFAVTQLDSAERAGIMTHASVLTSKSHAAENSWVHRGLFVQEQLLCGELPPPPVGVEVNDANDPNRLDDAQCAGCHIKLDPVGQGFDQYSPIGTFRTVDESGEAIDGAGALYDIAEVGEFNGVVELAAGLAESQVVSDCMAKQWFRFATRRKESEADECAIDELQVAFTDANQDIRELMVALVRSDALRYHAAE